MKINDREVVSSTIVIGLGQKAEIALPGQGSRSIELTFDPQRVTGCKYEYSADPKFVFGGPGNPLGEIMTVEMIDGLGRPYSVTFALYTLGESPIHGRVLHYTYPKY